MRYLLSLLVLGSLITQTAFAEVSESDFSGLISLFQKQYPGIEFQGSWDSDTVNAQAMRFDDARLIVMSGGLAREQATTLDSLAIMVCHEVGHHLGEKPYFPGSFGAPGWAAGEGAADYYSIHSCFNKMAPAIAEQNITLPPSYEYDLKQLCLGQPDPRVCRRALIAGFIIAKLQWQVLANGAAEPKFSATDSSRVSSTLLDYGSPQCRLDTFIASATNSARPTCWSPTK
ncbi:hypothetical protein [Bdellovibrio sp. HCB274]|uniref:hypothetical protein n=1 Tax=Bdellovibrio sp. HCB274 TaxID=3394361 RepID=UPI0039B4517F